jgi:hypothetical protein
LQERELVSFNGEVVMSLTILNQVFGQFSLGQQGIGGNGLTSDVDVFEQRGGCLDLVGSFDLVVTGYR